MKKPTEQDIIQIISLITKKPKDQIHASCELRGDLGMDSLAALDLLVTIEEQFGLVISHEVAANFKTIKDVFDHIKTL